MQVTKRDGRKEAMLFDKITARIKKLCWGLDTKSIDPIAVTQKIVSGLPDGVETVQIDELAAETAAYLSTQHPEFSTLAARIAVSNLHKQTEKSFSAVVSKLYHHLDEHGDQAPAPVVASEPTRSSRSTPAHHSVIVHDRDFSYDFFGFKTLQRAYLLRLGDKIVERPQHMLMRVSIGIHGDDLEAAFATYECMSKGYFTHATPTMFNAGTPHPQMSSCFLLDMSGDSIEGIFRTVTQCAHISKCAGGIGISASKVRANGSRIKRSGASPTGSCPCFGSSMRPRYVDQGGGKRPGAFAIYLEPWHADIFDFWTCVKITERRRRARATSSTACGSRLHAPGRGRRVGLFCPHECPGDTTWGEEFEAKYAHYESSGKCRRTLRAQELWFAILDSQIETGTPYMLYKDAANRKSNQQNLGTLRSSNLCTEIIEFTSPDEVAVCNLASISLTKCVANQTFDFEHLMKMTRILVQNLNQVIDRNEYPVPEAKFSNFRHRPIGLGVQGLADAFMLCRMPFDSKEAAKLNREIFEALYFAAISESCALAEKHGKYATFDGSPASVGRLQFDLWGVEPSDRHDWGALKERVSQHGLRNSLLVAPMPTASTAQILGNNECFEPYTSNIYMRRVLAGQFAVINRHLLQDLIAKGLWSDAMRQTIMANNGSVQGIDAIPEDMRNLYKTAYEIKQKVLIDMAADRGAFICQSQSLNLFTEEITTSKLSSMHFYGWKRGLKTGMYYLRTRPATEAIKFTLPAVQSAKPKAECEGSKECLSCGA